jgi:hypothetical protein
MPDFFDNNAAVLNSIQRHAIHIGAARPIDLIDGFEGGMGVHAILAQVMLAMAHRWSGNAVLAARAPEICSIFRPEGFSVSNTKFRTVGI